MLQYRAIEVINNEYVQLLRDLEANVIARNTLEYKFKRLELEVKQINNAITIGRLQCANIIAGMTITKAQLAEVIQCHMVNTKAQYFNAVKQ